MRTEAFPHAMNSYSKGITRLILNVSCLSIGKESRLPRNGRWMGPTASLEVITITWLGQQFIGPAGPSGRAVLDVGLRSLACCDCGFESHQGHECLVVVCVVCCHVEVSATSWSLVQRNPTDCDASLCVIRKPRERGGHSPPWTAVPEKIKNNS
jgi:hypothetical protein